MGDLVKKAGGAVSSNLTGGAFSTNGGGWAQGGDLKSVLNNSTYGISGKVSDANKINVPGSTARPEWNLSTPDGKLRSDLQLGEQMPGSFNQSRDVLDQLVTRATSTGPSQSAGYLQDANSRLTNNALDDATAQGNTMVANATSNLAMRGGMESGARERLQRGAGTETMMNKQRILNDSAGRNLDILSGDESQKLQMMQALPSSLLAQAGFEQGQKQFDITNTLGTVGNKYGTDMSAWAGNQAAREQAQLANKNKGALGLGFMGL